MGEASSGGLGARGPLRRPVRRRGVARRLLPTVGGVGAAADGCDGITEGGGGADDVCPLPFGPNTVSKYDRGLGEGVNVAVGTGDGVVGEAVPTASAANSASIDVFVGGAVSTASAANLASRASKGAARVSHAA